MMWVYHFHYSISNGAVHQSITCGFGWYLLIFALVIAMLVTRIVLRSK